MVRQRARSTTPERSGSVDRKGHTGAVLNSQRPVLVWPLKRRTGLGSVSGSSQSQPHVAQPQGVEVQGDDMAGFTYTFGIVPLFIKDTRMPFSSSSLKTLAQYCNAVL